MFDWIFGQGLSAEIAKHEFAGPCLGALVNHGGQHGRSPAHAQRQGLRDRRWRAFETRELNAWLPGRAGVFEVVYSFAIRRVGEVFPTNLDHLIVNAKFKSAASTVDFERAGAACRCQPTIDARRAVKADIALYRVFSECSADVFQTIGKRWYIRSRHNPCWRGNRCCGLGWLTTTATRGQGRDCAGQNQTAKAVCHERASIKPLQKQISRRHALTANLLVKSSTWLAPDTFRNCNCKLC